MYRYNLAKKLKNMKKWAFSFTKIGCESTERDEAPI